MKINNVDLTTICPAGIVQQWKTAPPTPNVAGGDSYTAHLLRAPALYHKTLTIDIKFRRGTGPADAADRAPDRDEIELNISQILALFRDPVELTLDTDNTRTKFFKGVLQSYKLTSNVNKGLSQKLSLTLKGYFHSPSIYKNLHFTGTTPEHSVSLNAPAIVTVKIDSIDRQDPTAPVVLYGLTKDRYTGESLPLMIPVPINTQSNGLTYTFSSINGKVINEGSHIYTDIDGNEYFLVPPPDPDPGFYDNNVLYDFPMLTIDDATTKACKITSENIYSAYMKLEYQEIY